MLFSLFLINVRIFEEDDFERSIFIVIGVIFAERAFIDFKYSNPKILLGEQIFLKSAPNNSSITSS